MGTHTRRGTRFATALFALATCAIGVAPACRRAASPPASQAAAPSGGSKPAAPGVAPVAPARSAGSGYEFTPAEAAAVDDFLRRHSDLRPATDADRHGSSDSDSDVRSLYGVYHPYFVRGDLNDDGILDFVVAFVRRDSSKSAPWFSVVVFLGKGGGGRVAFDEGSFIERDVTLARGDVSADRDSVVITPDLDDEAVRRYRWDAGKRTFVFVRDSDDETEPPSVSRTSAASSDQRAVTF